MLALEFGQRDVPDEPVWVLSERLRRRELSPVELATAVLDRVTNRNDQLNSYVTLADTVHHDALIAESEILRGSYRGALHGIPIAHKDVLLTRNLATTANSQVLSGHVPTEDADVVAALRSAGSILIGKSATYEFACGSHGVHGPPRNPWDLNYVAGGSSSGSANAVAAGLAVAATGTDTGGSIRVPASFCGIVGFKPSYDLLSRRGLIPVSWSLDHIGVLTRSVQDVFLLLRAAVENGASEGTRRSRNAVKGLLDAHALPPPGSIGLKGVSLGVPRGFLEEPVRPDVGSAVRDALDVLVDLGAVLKIVDLPATAHSAVAVQAILWPEATMVHRHWLKSAPVRYDPKTRRNVLIGGCLSAEDYLQGQEIRRLIRDEFAAAMAGVDAMVWPTLTRTAYHLTEVESWIGQELRLSNLAGTPSLTVPCGFTSHGLPVGLQFNGRASQDAQVLRLGLAFERATSFHCHLPMPSLAPTPANPVPIETSSPPAEFLKAQDEVRRTLRQRDLPVLDADVPFLSAMLESFRHAMRFATDGCGSSLEPLATRFPAEDDSDDDAR